MKLRFIQIVSHIRYSLNRIVCVIELESFYFHEISVKVPPLDQLYLGKEDEKMLEIKWKIFGWIMSLSDDVISAMKKLPKNFLLICAILYALVKVILEWIDFELFESP